MPHTWKKNLGPSFLDMRLWSTLKWNPPNLCGVEQNDQRQGEGDPYQTQTEFREVETGACAQRA